jgi:fido (protein-threonine AMPylation protein)
MRRVQALLRYLTFTSQMATTYYYHPFLEGNGQDHQGILLC